MAETPNDIGAGGGGFNLGDLGLRWLNNLFGFGGGEQGTAPLDLAGKYGGVFPGTRTPGAPAPVDRTPINPDARPADGARVEPYRGPASGGKNRKKRKKGIRELIRDQLLKEAKYYVDNPTELLRVLPPGRGVSMRTGRTGVARPAVLERFPRSYQRGSVGAQAKAAPRAATVARRARLTPRGGGGRIGQVRPRSSPAPLKPVQAPKASGARPGTRMSPYRLPADLKKSLPITDYDSEGTARDALRNLPFTDYDSEGINQPKPVAQPRTGTASARGSASRQGTASASARGVPASARRSSILATILPRNLPATAFETVLRSLTRRSPRVSASRNSQTGGGAQPIGDFPAASPTPAGAPKPIVGVIETLNPFPVPKYAYDYDKCNCPKPKKRKPKQPRTVCRAGAYTQTAKGISYHPNREVPCT